MNLNTFRLCLLLLLVSSVCLPAAKPKAATGTMVFDCHPPLFLDLRLPRLAEEGTLVLHLMWSGPEIDDITHHRSLSEMAQWCAGPDPCVLTKSTVRFKEFDLDKKASGTYLVELHDGRKLEGSFSVTRVPQQKPFLCE